MNKHVRLKCSTDLLQLEDRLKYNPHTIELHLVEEDLLNLSRLKSIVIELKENGITVVLHQPFTFNNILLDINEEGYNRDSYFYQLGVLSQLAEELDVYVVFHGNYKCEFNHISKELSIETYERISNINKYVSNKILWENAIWSSFSYDNEYIFDDIIKPLNLNLCFDISHAFISLKGDNKKLLELVKQVDMYVKHYHVVDSFGVTHDSLSLGEGLIDFKVLKPYIENKSYIFEINLKDQLNCEEMLNSSNYFKNL